MDLEEILKRTKAKSERITTTRTRPSIATEDRPYSRTDSELFNQKNSHLQSLLNAEETKNTIVTFFNPQNARTNDENDIKETDNKASATKPLNSVKIGRVKTDNKQGTNRQQTDNKQGTNRQQTDNKQGTNRQQTDNKQPRKERMESVKIRNWQQSDNTSDNKTSNKQATNRQQTGNKQATNVVFSELVGLQKEIIVLICNECKISRSKTTEALTLEYMAVTLKRSAGAIKTTIQRLEKKGCLLRVAFKNGRGGWSKYELPDGVYHDVIRSESANKETTNRQQTGNKPTSQPTTEPATRDSSSSSLNIKTTTTETMGKWDFDISPYAKFGFTISQLKQLASLGTISAAEVEQSLVEFNHDLTNDTLPFIKTGKINFLMGLLRSGHSYISEDFKNEQETIISEMARRAESKRKRLLEDKFLVWESSLQDEERKKIEDKIPLSLRVIFRTQGMSNLEVRSWIFNYYLQICENNKDPVVNYKED